MKKRKIQVTIITGFLGAGKTTFINHLLTKYSDIQFALVENEFGDVAIDTQLIKGVDASQMFELKKGCICCTIADEYELVLQELAERFPHVEHLLIETTGVAEPASVIRPFFSDKNLKELYTYNGTICLVDALNFSTQPEKEISVKQIVTADLVLINKSEKIGDDEVEEFIQTINKINPFAGIQLTWKNDLSDKVEIVPLQKKTRSAFDFLQFNTGHLKLESQTITFEKPLHKDSFQQWLSYNMDVYKNEIYRVKGILIFDNEPYEYILQGVAGSYEMEESDNFAALSAQSTIVLIGKLQGVQINKEMVEQY